MAVEDYSRETFDRQDAEAVLRVRRELGAEYDTELVNAFAERIERAVEARANESRYAVKRSSRGNPGGGRQFALGLFSLIFGVPITALANESTTGLVVAWMGIVGVNAAHAWQSRHK
jgi:hypothetical protein